MPTPYLSLADFEGKKFKPNLTPLEILLEVVEVAHKKFENHSRNGGDNGVSQKKTEAEEDDFEKDEANPVDDLSDREQMLRKAKLMKKPMEELEAVKEKEHDGEEKVMSSAIVSLRKITNKSIQKKRRGLEPLKKKEHSKGKKLMSSAMNLNRESVELSNKDWIKSIQKKKRRKLSGNGGPNPPPSLPEEFMREIINGCGGTEITRMIQKTLFATDIRNNHGRISMPLTQIETFDFLSDNEITHLRNERSITVPLIHKPTKTGVPVNQPPLIETPIEFRQWDMHKDKENRNQINNVSHLYVLRTAWNEIVLQNELKTGDVVQVWAFRKDEDRLCMALVVVERAAIAEESDEGQNQHNGSAQRKLTTVPRRKKKRVCSKMLCKRVSE